MVAVGVYSTVTFVPELVVVGKAVIGPLLVLIGAFVIWLESDEWKMKKQRSEEGEYQETFSVEKEQPEETVEDKEPETGTTQQDVKQAVQDSAPEEPEGYVCEECGREFDTQRGLSIHQSQKHKE